MAQQVDSKLAQACVDLYQNTYQGQDIKTINAAYTSEITFTVSELSDFLGTVSPEDIVHIKLGIYTADFVAKYPIAKEGRLTAFLYPVSKSVGVMVGDDPQPYNMGELLP